MSSRKLCRDVENRLISGVLAGLARYTNADVSLVRLGYVLLTLLVGIVPGIILYAVAALVIPPCGET